MPPSSLDPVGKRKRAAAEPGERAAKVARSSSGAGGGPPGGLQLDTKVGCCFPWQGSTAVEVVRCSLTFGRSGAERQAHILQQLSMSAWNSTDACRQVNQLDRWNSLVLHSRG